MKIKRLTDMDYKSIFLVFSFLLLVECTMASITIDGFTNTMLPPCYNATTGAFQGTLASVVCWDDTWNVAVNDSVTNVMEGLFNYSFSLSVGTYSCMINCSHSGCLDPTFSLYVRNAPINNTNISSILNTITGNASTILDDVNEVKTNQTALHEMLSESATSSNISDLSINLGLLNTTLVNNNSVILDAVKLNELESVAAGRYANTTSIIIQNNTAIILNGNTYWNTSDVSSLSTSANVSILLDHVISTNSSIVDITQSNNSAIFDAIKLNELEATAADRYSNISKNISIGLITVLNIQINTTWLGQYTQYILDNQTYHSTVLDTIAGYIDDVTGGGLQTIYDWLTTDGNVVQDDEITGIASEIGVSINESHGTGLYNVSASLTASSIAAEVGTSINESHGTGLYNTSASITPSAIAAEVGASINESHGTGLYNTSASITASGIAAEVGTSINESHGEGLYNVIFTESNLSEVAKSSNVSQILIALQSNTSYIIDYGGEHWNSSNSSVDGVMAKIDDLNVSLREFTSSNASRIINTVNANTTKILDNISGVRLNGDEHWNSSKPVPTQAILRVDLTKSGIMNLTEFDNVAPQFIYGTETPTNLVHTGTFYNHRTYILVDDFPSNITNAWLSVWLKYTGTPTTDKLQVFVEGTNIFNLTTGNLTTSLVHYTYAFDSSILTDEFVKFEFKGAADHNLANSFTIGYGDASSLYSYYSSDGSTYTKSPNEMALSLIIQYNQKSLAQNLNEEVFEVVGRETKTVCPGEVIIANWKVRDFTGTELNIDEANFTCIVEYVDRTLDLIQVSDAVIVTNLSQNREMFAMWNNTDDVLTNRTYHLSCNTTYVYGGHVHTFSGLKLVKFSRECDVLSNQTTIIETGNSAWVTGSSTGLSTDQNATLYGIQNDIGVNGTWDQSIAGMLGYNASDGNAETDLDSAGGTTPAAVYDYFVASSRALNSSNGWVYNITNDIYEIVVSGSAYSEPIQNKPIVSCNCDTGCPYIIGCALLIVFCYLVIDAYRERKKIIENKNERN